MYIEIVPVLLTGVKSYFASPILSISKLLQTHIYVSRVIATVVKYSTDKKKLKAKLP